MDGWKGRGWQTEGQTDKRTEGIILDVEADTFKLLLALVDVDFTKSLI